ncbi:MAG TPA: DUF3187 family protein [Thermoanaerobaculia bacterium]|jgi:hypothetical protein
MHRLIRVAAVVVLLLAAPLRADGNIESPMWIASQSPLQSLHLGLLPAVPRDLAPGEVSVQRSETWTNVWIDQRPDLLVDYEAFDSRIGVNVGLPRSMQFQIVLEDRVGTGGSLDPLIENFHRVIGNRDERHTVQRGTVNIEVRDPKTGALIIQRHSLGEFSRAASATLSRRHTLRRGEFAEAVSVRVPRKGSDPLGPGGADAGVSLAWSGLIGERSVHAGAGLSRLAMPNVGTLRVGRIEKTLLIAAAQPMTARSALITQYLFNASIARTGPLASGSHELTVGTRVHVTPYTAFDVGVVENIINLKNGPDFGLHFGLMHDVKRRR